MGWFWDGFKANVRESRRTWKRRLLRRLVAILLVIAITPIAMVVRQLTGSNAAGAIVAVPLLIGSVLVWWWIEGLLYDKADAEYFAGTHAELKPTTPSQDYNHAVAAELVEEPFAIPAKQPIYQPARNLPPHAANPAGGRGWALFAVFLVGSVLLMCGGLVGGGAFLIGRSVRMEGQSVHPAEDRFAEMHRRHEQRAKEFERRHQEMRDRLERDRERMRRPGW